ncbi:MAG: 30S ribosomal protein S20 [Candidatus Korobacteraceae bacterium]|jgi:small subunit ribosomal protein S20
MANHDSALRMRLTMRDLCTALTSGDKTALDTTYRETVSALDRSVRKGILHKKTASRCKSRLSARVKAATASHDGEPKVSGSFFERLKSLGYTRACYACGACSTGDGCDRV